MSEIVNSTLRKQALITGITEQGEPSLRSSFWAKATRCMGSSGVVRFYSNTECIGHLYQDPHESKRGFTP